ncbi:MAG TPA: hypothetical protein DD727_03200, partial [Clostridiales bacterium]|nr:hypothetical protein [Clostridiales bacterium]
MAASAGMKSIIYLYDDLVLFPDYPYLFSIGWERRTGKLPYDHDCRHATESMCMFQYTVAGEGSIEINGAIHKVKTG